MTREDSIKITRLRLGHTKYTHEHLMKKESPSTCNCGNRLTVTHIFEECPILKQNRDKYNIIGLDCLKTHDLRKLQEIIKFLKEADLYDKL